MHYTTSICTYAKRTPNTGIIHKNVCKKEKKNKSNSYLNNISNKYEQDIDDNRTKCVSDIPNDAFTYMGLLYWTNA